MGSATSRRTYAEEAGLLRTSCENQEQAWPLVYSENLALWKYSAVVWGFDPKMNYTDNMKCRLHPWCTAGRYFVVKFDKTPHPHDRSVFVLTITETLFKNDTQIRLPFAYHSKLFTEPGAAYSYMKPIEVVGYKDGIAVLQVNCVDKFVRFLVVHMKTETVIAVHKEPVKSCHFLYDCIISPDLSSFIIKPNAMFVLNSVRDDYDNEVKVVTCKGKKCHVSRVLCSSNYNAVRLFIAFDPRVQNRRVAIGNYLSRGRDIVAIYDLDRETVMVQSDAKEYQTTHNLTFSPDGSYIASLILGNSVNDGYFNFPRVVVYCSDELSVLHQINLPNLAETATLCPTALFPLFSETGTYLAVPYGTRCSHFDEVDGAFVYRVALPLNLQCLCRLTIRHHFDSQDVEKLPLPNKLKAFLRFQPQYV